jgi:serine protease AprX
MRDTKAFLLVIIFLIADISAMATATQLGEEVDERLPFRGDKYSTEEYGWWFTYGPDANFDGLDDRLERVMAGQESVSTTAILDSNGDKTVAIIIDFAWHPGQEEIDSITQILQRYGWDSNDAWFQVLDSLDAIVVDHVPIDALMAIHSLDSVVIIEMQNVMIPTMANANPATRIRPSEVYSGTVYDRGYDGEGIVIAVLDSGVDNEHRSLNDFDDEDDAPDLDPNSYDDQKWVAGFDATSQAANRDGSQDPDDGQGHGTHVAGIALGTGDSTAIHMGAAPGAYLVDVKVLTDSGGTNSQNSINGIQWMIENRDTNWGNGANGIQIGQMSFGSIGSPIDPNDTGDNGTSAEARLVNNATENGIVCVIAAGNDGKRRIASPGSADGAITVASTDDADTINRTDDFIADYSNSGPRDSDNDDDDWDELKPDVSSFGSGIMSASAATGTSFPGSPRPMANNDYESKDGTSMSTPLVSGVVALMLQADPSLTPEEVKDILRNSSEVWGTASETDVSDRWNSDWGFGLVDASCAIDMVLERPCTPLSQGGDIIITPPPGNGTDAGVTITSPTNGTWFIVDDMVRIQGSVVNNTGPWSQIDIKITQFLSTFEEITLINWTTSGGDVNSWYLDVLIKEDWVNDDETHIIIEARATGSGENSSLDARWGQIGRMMVSFGSPSSGSTLTDTVSFSGIAQGIEPSKLKYKINAGDWIDAHNFNSNDNDVQNWSFTWDSTEVSDGSHRVTVKLVNISGVESEITRRTFTVDNMPAAPALRFQGVVEILDQDLPATTAVAGTILEVHFSVVNTGDAVATDLHLVLNAPGSESSTYPNEGKIPRLDSGETTSIILWWLATEPGDHQVSLLIDPNGVQSEADVSDNNYTFDFTIEPRPVEPTLRFLTSAITTSPSIPSPSTATVPVGFSINVRVDNLGQNDATDIKMTLHWKADGFWNEIDYRMIAVIPGSTSNSGHASVQFTHSHNSVELLEYKVELTGDGVEAKYSSYNFAIIVDEYETGSATRLTLSDGEVALGFVGLPDGGLLFTTKDGELHARTVTPKFGMPGDTTIETNWAGEFAFTPRSDGRAHLAWSKRFNDDFGYTMTDISMASIGIQGDIGGESSYLNPLKQSEGNYWGFDLTERSGQVILAGYHRDISTSGSWNDITNVFLLQNEDGSKTTGWVSSMNVISDIDIKPQDGDPLAVSIGEKYIHLLYQEIRDDVTGEERVGLFYAHGELSNTPFTFQAPAGDDASMPEMIALTIDDEDVLVAAWIEGQGRTSELITVVNDVIWSNEQVQNVSAPGITKVTMMSFKDGSIKIFHDEIGVHGPAARYGMYNAGDEKISLSNLIGEGHIIGGGSIGEDGIVVMVSPSGQVSARKIAYLFPAVVDNNDDGLLDSLLAPLPGDTREQKLMVLGVIGAVLFLLFITVVVVLKKSHEEEEFDEEDSEIEILIQPEADDKVLIAIDDDGMDDLEVNLDKSEAVLDSDTRDLSQELEAKIEAGEASPRLERRMKRKEEREVKEKFDELISQLPPPGQLGILPMPPPPSPDELGMQLPELPTLPAPSRNVMCTECDATITVKDMTLRKMDCPICSANIDM